MFKVQVISTETIKPSSPTPSQFQSLKLSMLDLLSPRMYIPLIFFYTLEKNGYKTRNAARSCHLKISLSETLTNFFPLAGRIKEADGLIHNSDEGVDFVEARVDLQLSEFVRQPNVEMLNQFLPCDFIQAKSGRDVLLAIQLNHFDCGGIAIGVNISHLVADMGTMSTLINSWAATARGASDASHPTFDATSLFPPREVQRLEFPSMENISTKRFVFTHSSIEALRAKYTSYLPLRCPTRVEAVSAFIWRCFIRNTCSTSAPVAAAHAVNLRTRIEPPLPDCSFGNLWVLAATSRIRENDLQKDARGLLEEELRGGIRRVDSDFIRKLQGANETLKDQAAETENYSINNLDHGLIFSSWCRFPLYEADFGWGKPIWVSTSPMPIKNCTILMRSACGDGIEAWMNMEEEDMAKFEQDEELLSFVSSPTTS